MLCRAGQSLVCSGKSFTGGFFLSLMNIFPAGRRTFSQSAVSKSYADTIRNLLIHKDTRVLVQGLGKTVIVLL
jgi:succinyl-CoA synthetase alpha subunit